jgi:hypothetical protein
LISRRNLDPRALDLAVERPRSSLLPSSIQLLRCTAEAVRRPGAALLAAPASPLVSELRESALIRGSILVVPDAVRRFGGPACEPSRFSSRYGTRRSSRVGPELFSCVSSCRCGGGGDEETRTPDPLLAKEMLCQLSYVPVYRSPREVVGAPGLEPGTSALSGPRSNQLSYAP